MNNITYFESSSSFEAASGGGTLNYPNTSYIEETEQIVLDEKPDNQFSLTFKIPTVEQLDEVFTIKYGYDEANDNTKPLYLYNDIRDTYYTPEEYWVNFGIEIRIIRISADNLYPFNEAHCKKILIDGEEFYNRTRASWSLYRSVYVKPDTEHTVTYVMTNENWYDLATSISDIIDINGEKKYNAPCLTKLDFSKFDSTNFIFGCGCWATHQYDNVWKYIDSSFKPEIIGGENINLTEGATLDCLFEET